MSSMHLRGVIQKLRRVVDPEQAGGLTDAALLRRWTHDRDEAAFETLLWRLGPMVLGVCQRVLHDGHEAEDALQASFLILVRKAASIGRGESLAGWMHKVAYRVALETRTRAARGGVCASPALDFLPGAAGEDLAWRDLRPLLDEEIQRLPEKCRLAFVLCCLQGKTNEEAAREIGCPLGTLLSRLHRARDRLRSRLTRRGIQLAIPTAGFLLAQQAAPAIPPALVSATLKAATWIAAGKKMAGVVSTPVAMLTQGVLQTMMLAKVKFGATAVLAVALLGGGGMATYRGVARESGQGTVTAQTQGPARTASPRQIEKEMEVLRKRLAEKESELRALQAREAALADALKQLEVERLQAQKKMLDIKDLAARIQPNGPLVADNQKQTDKEVDYLRQRLAEREKELQLFKDRATVLEQKLKQLEAERQLTHKQLEDVNSFLRQNVLQGARVNQPQPAKTEPKPTVSRDQALQLDNARDEIELQEAQLLAKRAQVEAAQVAMKMNMDRLSRSGGMPQAEKEQLAAEVAIQKAQLIVKQAELKEPEIRLRQANRRLIALQSGASVQATPGPDQGQRLAELEKKLDAVLREIEVLQRQRQPSRP
jgi:RNA polymerase sigma factor (sigma-70 family)